MLESGEMYLESIYVLRKSKENIRAIDIVEYMNYSKPSVSRAISKLKSEGFLSVSPEGYIELTQSGRSIAFKIYERHQVLSDMLIKLGVSKETAVADACKMEHDISDETFEAIKKHTRRI